MLKATGSVTVEFVSDDEKIEKEVDGSEFGLEEGSWRELGEGARQYEAPFNYIGEGFSISFQATYLDGQITVYPLSEVGQVKITANDIYVEYCGSDNPEDDHDD